MNATNSMCNANLSNSISCRKGSLFYQTNDDNELWVYRKETGAESIFVDSLFATNIVFVFVSYIIITFPGKKNT